VDGDGDEVEVEDGAAPWNAATSLWCKMFAAKPAITIASFDSFLPATSCHSALLLQVLQAFSLCFDSIWCPSRQRNQQDAVQQSTSNSQSELSPRSSWVWNWSCRWRFSLVARQLICCWVLLICMLLMVLLHIRPGPVEGNSTVVAQKENKYYLNWNIVKIIHFYNIFVNQKEDGFKLLNWNFIYIPFKLKFRWIVSFLSVELPLSLRI